MQKSSLVKVSVVSYLNSKPFIFGLENSPIISDIDLQMDSPSTCAEKLIDGRVDIGLVPVAILPELPGYRIVSDYCIGATGNVNSVLLLSEVPLADIHTILLDYQSRTSVILARVLAEKFWKIRPEWKNTEPGFEYKIKGSTAGVIIGDRALEFSSRFHFKYDLSGEWHSFTGLPFVFACWVSNKILPEGFITSLNDAFQNGVSHLNEVIRTYGTGPVNNEIALDYLSHHVSYSFDDPKKEALQLFIQYLKDLQNNDVVKVT